MHHRSYAIVEAPSILGLKPTGVEQLPQALLRHGLMERLKARSTTPLVPPAYDPEIDPATQTLNAEAIAQWSPQLADAVEKVIDRDELRPGGARLRVNTRGLLGRSCASRIVALMVPLRSKPEQENK